MKKVLFLYSGASRAAAIKNFKNEEIPDSFFGGFNYLQDKEDLSISLCDRDFIIPNRHINKLLKKISIVYALVAIFNAKLYTYDYVISSTNIDILLIKNFIPFFLHTRWIITNVNLTTLLSNKNKIVRKIFIYALKKSFRILCLSTEQKNYLLQCGVSEDKLLLIHLGVDVNFHKESKKDDGYILSVGRDKGRDYSTLFLAVNDLYPTTVICSPSNINNEKVPHNVKVLFDINHMSLRDYYDKARIIIVPSKPDGEKDGSDCSGQTVILEAMAHGKLVIATYREWMDDYFQNEREIIIVEPRNPEELRKKIIEYFNNEEKRKTIERNGSTIVKEKYSTKNFSEQIYSIISEEN